MYVFCYIITIKLYTANNLKQKRSFVKSLLHSTQYKFNVSMAEVGMLAVPKVAQIGYTIVSNERKHLEKQQTTLSQFINDKILGNGDITDIMKEEIKIV